MKKIFLLLFLLLATPLLAQFQSDIILTSPNAAWTDARAYSTLNAAITAAGANERTILIPSPQTVSTLVVPSNITLEFTRDGSISNTDQLTIQTTKIIAPNRQIFTGVGNIDFANGTIVKSGWFSNFESALALTVNDKVTLEITKAQTLTASCSVGTNVAMRWPAPYNIITVDTGLTLSNMHQPEAGDYQILAGSGTVDFDDGILLDTQWFDSLRTVNTWAVTSTLTYRVSGTVLVDFNTTIPTTVVIDVDSKSGFFNVSNGVTLTIQGLISTLTPHRIFSTTGTVIFSASPNIIYPQWWGAVGNGTTDDTAAFNAAFTAIDADGGILFMPSGTYYLPNGWDISKYDEDSSNSWTIRGAGLHVSTILTHNANISLDVGGRNRVFLEDFGIYDDGTTAKVGIARYRAKAVAPAVNGSGHFHTYSRIIILGKYSIASIYSIASEVNSHHDLEVYNYGNGAAYYTGPTNYPNLVAGQDFPDPADTSNTVNNFYGGTLSGSPSTTGGAVLFGPGIADNVNFYGTYLVGYSGGYNVRFGYHQGKVVFDGCRFEGSTYSIEQYDDLALPGEVWGLHVTNSTLGPDTGIAEAIKWRGSNAGAGLVNAYINNNWMNGKNVVLLGITNSYIRIPQYLGIFSGSDLTLYGNVSTSYLEAPTITITAGVQINSSKVVRVDSQNATYRENWGPNPANNTANDAYGSAVVYNPFSVAPSSPVKGMIVTALGGITGISPYWDPISNEQGGVYPVWYDGARWRPMIPITSDINAVGQYKYTDADLLEKTLNSLVIPAGTLGPMGYSQIMRIRASGLTASNGNTKTIRLKLSDGTNTVTFVQNTVTTAPNDLAWNADCEIVMESVYALGYWAVNAKLEFNGVAPHIVNGFYSGAGSTIDFSKAVTLSVTGQNGTAAADDIANLTLSWSLVHAE